MTEDFITSANGQRLFVRSWQSRSPRATIVIVPGFNSHSGYYQWVGEQLSAGGLNVYALDLRGRGRSPGERFYVESFADYVSDVESIIVHVKTQTKGLPIFLLGHSAGGVVASLYALDHPTDVQGLISESFAYRLPAPGFALAALKGLGWLIPHTPVLKLKNSDFSRDPDMVRAMDADPLIKAESQPARTAAALIKADERLKAELPDVTLPLLILHGTNDKAALAAGSQSFHAVAGSRDKTLRLYDGYVHDLLNDVGKEAVLADIGAWIDRHLLARAA